MKVFNMFITTVCVIFLDSISYFVALSVCVVRSSAL